MQQTRDRQSFMGSLPAGLEIGQPNHTIYIQNLNEKINLKYLRMELENILSPYGPIHNMILKRRLALKGQAFIIFDTIDSAKRAIASLQGQKLFGKSMICRFARFKSDIIAERDGTLDIEKKHRMIDKIERSKTIRLTRRQILAQMMGNPMMSQLMMVGPTASLSGAVSGIPLASMGPEMQLPNKVLFVQSIPFVPISEHDKNTSNTSNAPTHFGTEAKEGSPINTLINSASKKIEEIFKKFPGFCEARFVPNRPDVAFIEYENELQANNARQAMDKHELISNQPPIRVTFSKR